MTVAMKNRTVVVRLMSSDVAWLLAHFCVRLRYCLDDGAHVPPKHGFYVGPKL